MFIQRKKMKFFDLLPFILLRIKKTPITIQIPIELRKNNVSDTMKTSLPYKIRPSFASSYIVNGNGGVNHNYYKFSQHSSQGGEPSVAMKPKKSATHEWIALFLFFL